jgi:hypothetical protein
MDTGMDPVTPTPPAAPGPWPAPGPPPAAPAAAEGAPEAFELLAASLRADSDDLSTFVEVLAGKLEGALPGRAQVERHARKLLSHDMVVRRIAVDLGDVRYTLEMPAPGQAETRRAKVVRGIVLSTEQLELPAWTESLARDLARQAASSEQARLALERLLA